MRIAWRTVGGIVTRVVAANDQVRAAAGVDRLDGLRRIGIDEISYRRGQKYVVVVEEVEEVGNQRPAYLSSLLTTTTTTSPYRSTTTARDVAETHGRHKLHMICLVRTSSYLYHSATLPQDIPCSICSVYSPGFS